jgi:hypothetical protein
MDESAPDVNHGQTGPVALRIRLTTENGPARQGDIHHHRSIAALSQNAMSRGLAAQVTSFKRR